MMTRAALLASIALCSMTACYLEDDDPEALAYDEWQELDDLDREDALDDRYVEIAETPVAHSSGTAEIFLFLPFISQSNHDGPTDPVYDGHRIAQTFTLTDSRAIKRVSVYVGQEASYGSSPLSVRITAVDATGAPAGPVSPWIAGYADSASIGWRTAVFATGISLQSGTYAMELSSSIAPTQANIPKLPRVYTAPTWSNPYAGGSYFRENLVHTWNRDDSTDLAFKLYDQ